MLLETCNSAIGRLGFHVQDGRRARFSVEHRRIEVQVTPFRIRRGRHKTLRIGRGIRVSRLACNVATTQGEVFESKQGEVFESKQGEVFESKPPDASDNGNAREAEEEGEDEAPLFNALRECAEMDAAAFHFPGHRRGAGAPPMMTALIGTRAFASDLPELPELDNLHAAEGVIHEAQSKAARLFGAEQTWFLVNGSTCGIQAAVMATCRQGDHLILPRNVHMSAVSAMVLSGALPKYLNPKPDLEFGIAHGVQAVQVEAAIDEIRRAGNRVGAVLVVSPTYFGVCSHITSIAHVCHAHNVSLIVDEAHGAHFRFHRNLPHTALEQGADVAVQSTHKVLSSLTQSAMLHTQGSRIDRAKLSQCLQMLQSSSPSYLLLASLDASRAHMARNCQFDAETGVLKSSDPYLDAAISLASRVRQVLQKLPGLSVLDTPGIDPLRITVGLRQLRLTGFEADDILRLDHDVVAEFPSLRSITFAISAGSSPRDATRLIHAFAALSVKYSTVDACCELVDTIAKHPEFVWENSAMALSPRDAFHAPCEKVRAREAVGRVSAELVCPYPPGIPVVTPGEIITQDAVDCITAVLAEGGVVSGASDESFQFAKVVVLRDFEAS